MTSYLLPILDPSNWNSTDEELIDACEQLDPTVPPNRTDYTGNENDPED